MRWGITVLAIALLITLVWVSGCANLSLGTTQVADFGGNSVDAQQAQSCFINKYGNPVSYSGQSRFLEPMVSDGISNNTPTNKVTKFSKDTPSVYAWAFYEGFKPGDLVAAAWTFNGKQFASLAKPVAGNYGLVYGQFDMPKSGWALGTHTITISGNGVQGSATFDIINGQTQTVPLPCKEAQAGNVANSPSVDEFNKNRIIKPVFNASANQESATDNTGYGSVSVGGGAGQDIEKPGLAGGKSGTGTLGSSGTGSASGKLGAGANTVKLSPELSACAKKGQVDCGNGICRDILTDNQNCGGCGNICQGGQPCLDGYCGSPDAPGSSVDFGGVCPYCAHHYQFVSDHPSNFKLDDFSEELNGVAHDNDFWYFTTRSYLWKIPITVDINEDFSPDPSIGLLKVPMPSEISYCGWHGGQYGHYYHYGDLYYQDGLLFIPVESTTGGCGDDDTPPPPIIAVFRASDLTLLAYDYLYFPAKQAPWCAINPKDGKLYTSNDEINQNNPIRAYNIDWPALLRGERFLGSIGYNIYLYTESGDPMSVDEYLQGGEFSDDGLLYLNHGKETGINEKNYGIKVFDTTTWRMVTKSTNGYGDFNYEFHTIYYQEPEGLTLWDLDQDTRAPHIHGQLHVMMLDNNYVEPNTDGFYFKHYRVT